MVEENFRLSKSALLCCLWIAGILLFTFRQYYFVSSALLAVIFLFPKYNYRDKLVILAVIGISIFNILLRETDNLQADAILKSYSNKCSITAEIANRQEYEGGYSKYTVKIKYIEESRANINAIVYFTEELVPGQIVSLKGELSEIPGARNPYAFDRKKYYRNKGIHLQIRSAKLDRILYHKFNYNFLIYKIHSVLKSKIRLSFGEHTDFVMAILLGDKSGIENYEEYTESGTNHLLAMSGLHLGLLAVIFSSVGALFIRNRKKINLLVIILLLVYASACGWSSSITRSFLMISLFLLSKILVRKVHVQDIFFSAVLLILILNPYELFMIGFQFSVSAVFSLIFVLPVIVKKLGLSKLFKKKLAGKSLASVASLLLSSAIIMVFHFPITYYHFSSVNFNGLLANLISIPFFSILVLPYALIVLVCPSFCSDFLSSGFSFIMSIFSKLTQLFANLPFNMDFLRFSPILMTILLAISVSFILIYILRNRINSKMVWIQVLTFIPIVCFSIFIINKKSPESSTDRISFFDVASGDACLLELASGEKIMIDSGRKDFAGNIAYNVFPYMKHNGIRHIDYLVITHAHDDHYGGLKELTAHCTIDTLITTQSVVNAVTDDFPNIRLPHAIIISDTSSFSCGNADIRVIHPALGYTDDNENNMSVTCLISLNDWNFMFTGDIESVAEELLSQQYGVSLKSDFLKVAHHGSATSSSPEFLQYVNPDFAYIPDGFRNRFGFPSKKVLYNLQQEGIKYFSGSQDGFLQISVHADSLCFDTFISNKRSILKKDSNEDSDNSTGKNRRYSSVKKAD